MYGKILGGVEGAKYLGVNYSLVGLLTPDWHLCAPAHQHLKWCGVPLAW